MNQKQGLSILLIAILFIVGCATVPITGRKQLSFVPHSQLIVLGRENYKKLISESKLSSDTEKTKMVIRVGTRVARAAEEFMRENGMEEALRNYEWEFNLIEDDEVINAFCMPGGKIGVYTGMLPVAQDEEGLAVVVAHEVAHAIANHGSERTSQLLLTQLGGFGLAAALKEEPKKTRRLWLIAYGIGSQVGFILPYSRVHEAEADYIGLILMAKAGYDPRATIPFLERMKAQGGPKPPEFLSTHPAPQRRIDDIREKLPLALDRYEKQGQRLFFRKRSLSLFLESHSRRSQLCSNPG